MRQRPFRLTPEERVRQALVWFLREGCSRAAVLREYVRFGVEESSLDVAAFSACDALDKRFRPRVTVVIAETKRMEEELAHHVGQLKTYLLRERCRAGLLFNGRQATWLSLAGEFEQPQWTAEPLADLQIAEERIEQASMHADAYLADAQRAFKAAVGGDFDALAKLVSLFGSDLGLTFDLSIRSKGSLGRVHAFSVKADAANLLTYRDRGVTSRHRQRLSPADFHSLVELRPV
ncbi:MAG: hypothetical protein ACHQ9S_04105 [Candidatus Binatia bacterium]